MKRDVWVVRYDDEVFKITKVGRANEIIINAAGKVLESNEKIIKGLKGYVYTLEIMISNIHHILKVRVYENEELLYSGGVKISKDAVNTQSEEKFQLTVEANVKELIDLIVSGDAGLNGSVYVEKF